MVLLMGDERVVPKAIAPMAGKEVHRRSFWRFSEIHAYG
jgi:hypothetical protein